MRWRASPRRPAMAGAGATSGGRRCRRGRASRRVRRRHGQRERDRSSGEPVRVGVVDRLGAVAGADLGEHVVDVGLDRRLADDERRRDLAVRQPGGDQREDLGLARGELVGQARRRAMAAAGRRRWRRRAGRSGRPGRAPPGGRRRRGWRGRSRRCRRPWSDSRARPRWSASRIEASSAWVVSTTISVSGCAARIRRVASTPSTPGMRRSISTTSGRWRAASATASSPSVAAATGVMSGAASSSVISPSRTSAWSSTTITRTAPAHGAARRGAGPRPAAAARPASRRRPRRRVSVPPSPWARSRMPFSAVAAAGLRQRARLGRPRAGWAGAPVVDHQDDLVVGVLAGVEGDRHLGARGRACARWSAPPGRRGARPGRSGRPAGPGRRRS